MKVYLKNINADKYKLYDKVSELKKDFNCTKDTYIFTNVTKDDLFKLQEIKDYFLITNEDILITIDDV
jgi:hypothetical protein